MFSVSKRCKKKLSAALVTCYFSLTFKPLKQGWHKSGKVRGFYFESWKITILKKFWEIEIYNTADSITLRNKSHYATSHLSVIYIRVSMEIRS